MRCASVKEHGDRHPGKTRAKKTNRHGKTKEGEDPHRSIRARAAPLDKIVRICAANTSRSFQSAYFFDAYKIRRAQPIPPAETLGLNKLG
jgi:hypothetical protein